MWISELDEKKKEKGYKPLVRCPVSCLIHVCHNSFHKGLKQYGDNAEELCLNLYYFFKNNPSRREDLFAMEHTWSRGTSSTLPHSVQMVITDTRSTEIGESEGGSEKNC